MSRRLRRLFKKTIFVCLFCFVFFQFPLASHCPHPSLAHPLGLRQGQRVHQGQRVRQGPRRNFYPKLIPYQSLPIITNQYHSLPFITIHYHSLPFITRTAQARDCATEGLRKRGTMGVSVSAQARDNGSKARIAKAREAKRGVAQASKGIKIKIKTNQRQKAEGGVCVKSLLGSLF